MTTLEIKSGYGLNLDIELKMLRVGRELQSQLGIRVINTFLGAHALPSEYAGRQDEYVRHIVDDMLPAVAAEGLADCVDAYHEGIAFTADDEGKTRLYVVDSDGSNSRVLTDSLALRGSPAWWPDGESIVSAAVGDGEPRLMRIFLNGAPPAALVAEYSVDPVWSPDGKFLVYSGADVGTTFPLRAAEADGRPHPLPGLMLTRGARRVAFLHDRPTLIFLSGEVAHKNLWLMDLTSGNQRALTELPQDFVIGDFDVSADGTELVLDRVEQSSELALIERPQ